MRGEHLHAGVDNDGKPGSSPHARGTPHSACKFDQPDGIIPACAGNTTGLTAAALLLTDHPRMRGEHQGKTSILDAIRIIPACAGNTEHAHNCPFAIWDHPRMRGEHTKKSQ